MEKVEFLNQTDFGEVLKQNYKNNYLHVYANPMVLLNYLSSFDNGTILKIDVNDDRYTHTIGRFIERYVFGSMEFVEDSFNINTFHVTYGIPIFIRFITSVTNIDLSKVLMENRLNGFKLTNERAYEYLTINEIYRRQGVDRSITQMDIINFGFNEIMALDKLKDSYYFFMGNILKSTYVAIMYYIKYRQEYDSILNYLAEFIVKNNYQELFRCNCINSNIHSNHLKNILVFDFNYPEYQADKYIEEFYNKCTIKTKG